jgi:hypothetical protein
MLTEEPPPYIRASSIVTTMPFIAFPTRKGFFLSWLGNPWIEYDLWLRFQAVVARAYMNFLSF